MRAFNARSLKSFVNFCATLNSNISQSLSTGKKVFKSIFLK